MLSEARCTGVVDCSSKELANVLVRIVSSQDDVCISAPWTLVNLLPSAVTCVLRSSDEDGGAADIDPFTVASGAQRPQFSTGCTLHGVRVGYSGAPSHSEKAAPSLSMVAWTTISSGITMRSTHICTSDFRAAGRLWD